MTDLIDAEDLALLGTSFEAAMADAPGAGDADAALFELGWGELLAAAPAQGAATAFRALGTTGSAACLLDDVIANALGIEASPTTCVVLPAAQSAEPPARLDGDRIVVDGLVSARRAVAGSVVVAVDVGAEEVSFRSVDASVLSVDAGDTIDPANPVRRVTGDLPVGDATEPPGSGVGDTSWDDAVAAARVALAHQLTSASRWMLDEARQHAVDRVQFGRPIASFQALRHKLAETLVAIEGAEAVAGACGDDADPLSAALAKSLAGRAGRTASKHAQQVLAGIGFTTDHQLHLWLKRVLVVDALFGSAATLPVEIGRRLVGLGHAPRLVEL